MVVNQGRLFFGFILASCRRSDDSRSIQDMPARLPRRYS